ncbi:MAG: hypothetical protein J6M95_02860 [Bacilli bacterium]|nr:hypothetical protein [Bacilli bacterium]
MKRITKLLLSLLIPLTIFSCSSSNKSEDFSDVKENEIYYANSWDDTIDKLIRYSIGDQAKYIPVFTSINYEAFVSKTTSNNQLIKYTNIKCFGVSNTTANRLYGEKLEEKEFSVVGDYLYAYRFVDYSSDLFVNYGIMTDESSGTTFFNLQLSIRKTRETTWDGAFIKEYLEVDVPSYEAPAYNFVYDSYYERIVVNALFVEDNALTKYSQILQSNSYVITNTDTANGGIQLLDPTGYITITLYSMVGEYECNLLYIAIDNAWPTLEIGAFLGVYLPKLEGSETATYWGWTYYDPDQEDGSTDDYVLLIYYDYASEDDYDHYLDQLVAAGFNKGEETEESGVLSTPLFAIHPNGSTLEMKLQYQISSQTICLAIYQAYKA